MYSSGLSLHLEVYVTRISSENSTYQIPMIEFYVGLSRVNRHVEKCWWNLKGDFKYNLSKFNSTSLD